MNIVFLEKGSLGDDIDLSYFSELGQVTFYDVTRADQVAERSREADVIIVNKLPMNADTLGSVPNLKMIALTATGTNNIDWDYTNSRGICVKNVAGYSTNAVAQHTFALLFYVLHRLAYYDHYVKSGEYCLNPGFSHFAERFTELEGKTWGIVGMGAIGQRVASIASAFGCREIYYSTSGKNTEKPYQQVTFRELLEESDVISLHAPLNADTEGLMNAEAFHTMKKTAFLVNVARGGLVVEKDLAEALKQDEIAGAALDVLTEEPMKEYNPLYEIKDSRKLLITPHMAWAPVETRERLMRCVYKNIQENMCK